MLDANIVIEAYRAGVWDRLTGELSITLPSVVVEESSFFVDSSTNDQIPIHLTALLQSGIIARAEATLAELQDFYAQFNRVFVESLDAGEAEALALLMAGHLVEHYFCTGDGPAIRALALLGLSERGISLESLLRSVGLGRKLGRPFGESFFREQLHRGQEMRIRGDCLAVGSRFRPF